MSAQRQRVGPTKFFGAEPATDGSTVRLPDGREMLDANIIIDEDSVEQIRLGYKCIRCHEPQSQPFPAVCESVLPDGVTRWCNFPIREKQAAEFAAMYKGEVSVGSKVNLSDEAERLAELDAYEEKHGIVLPDSVKFPNGSI